MSGIRVIKAESSWKTKEKTNRAISDEKEKRNIWRKDGGLGGDKQ